MLWHTEVEQETPAEVAPLLGLTPNGVAALAYRAREGLRQAYLQEHLADGADGQHRATVDRLGAWARGGLSPRQRARVDAHLATWPGVPALAGELEDVNGLRGWSALLGGAAAAAYLAAVRRRRRPPQAAATAPAGAGDAAAGAGAAGPQPLAGAAGPRRQRGGEPAAAGAGSAERAAPEAGSAAAGVRRRAAAAEPAARRGECSRGARRRGAAGATGL